MQGIIFNQVELSNIENKTRFTVYGADNNRFDIGQYLYVKEAHKDLDQFWVYEGDDSRASMKHTPALAMPLCMARNVIKVTNKFSTKLSDVSNELAMQEGYVNSEVFHSYWEMRHLPGSKNASTCRYAIKRLWDHHDYEYEFDPDVTVYEFELVKKWLTDWIPSCFLPPKKSKMASVTVINQDGYEVRFLFNKKQWMTTNYPVPVKMIRYKIVLDEMMWTKKTIK